VLELCVDREEKRNSLTSQCLEQISQAVTGDLADIHAIVIRSTGTRYFSSGGDLSDISSDISQLAAHERRGLFAETIHAIRSSPVPVVCAVQGLCLAAGIGLALASDLVVASADSEFGLPELNVGLWPFYVSALLALHVSPKHAMDLMLTRERISAEQARDWGLVSRVVAEDSFDREVDALVGLVSSSSRAALVLGKRTANAVTDQDLDRSLMLMQAHLSLLSTSEESRALMRQFLERRR